MKKIFIFFILLLICPVPNLNAEKTTTLEGVVLAPGDSSPRTGTASVKESFYTETKKQAPGQYSFVDLQVLEPLDKWITYNDSVTVKGLVSKNIDFLNISGSPVKVRSSGAFLTEVNFNNFGKQLIEVIGRTKTEELVIKKRVLYLASFKDVRPDKWASEIIEYLATLGYLKGNAAFEFKPLGVVSRAELAVILARVNKIKLAPIQKIDLRDVSVSSWSAPAIAVALERGWLKSSASNYFYPERAVTRAELFSALSKSEGIPEVKNLKIGPFPDVSPISAGAGSIAALKKTGWFDELVKSKQAKFYPDQPVTRKELAFWLAKLSLVSSEINDLLNWEKGFGPEAQNLTVEQVAAAAAVPKKPEVEPQLKLAEKRPKTEPPKEKEIVAQEAALETAALPKEKEPEVISIVPQREIIPATAGKFISFDLKEADISDVLKIFAQEMNANVIAGSDVSGKVNISFNKVALQDAFETVLKMANCTYIKEGDIILVYPVAKVGNLLGRQTIMHIYKIGYADLGDLTAKVTPVLSKFGEIITDKRLRLFIARDLAENFDNIDQIVKALDAPPKQVLVEAAILDISLTGSRSLGAKFLVDPSLTPGMTDAQYQSLPPHTFVSTEGFAGAPGTTGSGFYVHVLKQGFRAYLNALKSDVDFDVLANPRIIALNHEEASILAGDQIGYLSSKTTSSSGGTSTVIEQVSFFETGIKLVFTPHITEDGFILMEMHPEVSEGQLGENKLPFKKTTETTTKVLVKDGQTILLGGLIRERNKNTETGIPLLSNLPFLGTLFRKKEIVKEKREMIVLITPHIIDEAMLKKFDQEKKDLEKKQIDKGELELIR